MADDTKYGSLGALAPKWSDGERNIDTDEIYERFFEWVADVKGVEPWPHQEEAIMDLLAGDHVILNTPTGSGKSLVALGMHFAALCTGRRSYYTAPIKALVSEKFFDLVEVFGRENVGMITGDTHINADAPIICCTAEILANQALREGRHADVGCVAMDEFHYYGDSERGWAWQVPLLTLPNTQFLLMSATLGNVDAIADKLEDMTDTDVDIIADAPRPVPLTYEYTLDPLEKTVELAFGRGETPIYVVHFSQDAALETANALASTGVSSKEQRAAIAEAIKGTKFTTAFGKILQRLLRTGVGIHHAGMLPRYRRLVEQLAQQGLLPVICGTDTLGVGINVPIHSVVLTALTKFDGTKMRKLRAREFHQIAGRAGRMGFDTEGLVIAEGPEFEIENAKALAKAGNDPKKLKKVKRKKAPEGFVTWNENTFDKLIDATPETLVPHMKVTHSMVLNEVNMIPKFFAKLHPKHKTPINALILIGSLTMLAPFAGRKMLVWISDAGNFGCCVAYCMVALSFIILRKKEPDMPRPYKVPAYKFFGTMAVIMSGFMVAMYCIPGSGGSLIIQEWGIVLAWCALGVVFFVFCKKKYKESFGTLVELISDEDAATLMPEADEVELDKVIDAAIDRVLAKKAS